MTRRTSSGVGRWSVGDPYRQEALRRVTARVPVAFGLLAACAAMSTVFEIARFPERRAAILVLDAILLVLVAGALAWVRARPAWSVCVMVASTNAIGVLLNAYHSTVNAEVAMSIWSLTGLLASAAIVLPWGWRSQALASVGAVVSYPLMLRTDPLVLGWAAGAVYLAMVVGLGVFGAGLIDQYLATDFELARTLSEREARLRSYFELSLVGTAILSFDLEWIEVNEEFCRILGCSRDELLRRRWADLVAPDQRPADREHFASVVSGREAARWWEGRLVRRDGGVIHGIISIRGLPGRLGTHDHLLVVVQDVTERRRVEEEREELLAREQLARREAEAGSRAKDDFLAVVSHELRSPLAAILGWTPLLRGGRLRPERQRYALEAIEHGGRSLGGLIDDLLDASRMIAGKLRLSRRPVDVCAVVAAAVDSVRATSDAKGVVVATKLAGAAVVDADPDRLQQVVWNLLSNAVKFTEPGGRVEVAVERSARAVAIHVRDTGIGIPPELLPRVFDRFWQADASTNRRHGGLGLGLSITRHLVELHGGTVAAESPGEGRGTTFTVRLPVTVPGGRVAAQPVDEPVPPAPALHGMRALVVDDEEHANELVRIALEHHGVEVKTATSAGEALALLEGWAPNVLVSDIAMPVEDGYSLIRRVRAREASRGGRVPALALTVLARAEDRSRALAAGFDAYLAKPVDEAGLLAAISSVAAGSGDGAP